MNAIGATAHIAALEFACATRLFRETANETVLYYPLDGQVDI